MRDPISQQSVHAHVGGINQTAPCFSVIDKEGKKQNNASITNQGFSSSFITSLANQTSGWDIISRKRDLQNAPYVPVGPYGQYGKKLTSSMYHEQANDINQKYNTLFQSSDHKYVQDLGTMPPHYQQSLYDNDKNSQSSNHYSAHYCDDRARLDSSRLDGPQF